jgi:Protein of unknown function (DUF1153)
MTSTSPANARFILGPYGTPLSGSDLPRPDTQRWVIRRKAEVVAAVQGGLLTLDEACNRYGLTADEFMTWQASFDRYGISGLKIKHFGHYRQREACGLA